MEMATGVSAKVFLHPVVLFQIIDAYERRSADTPRVIGALLGMCDKSGKIEVSNSYCVLHKEHDDKVEADLCYASDMYDLNLRVFPGEAIVGWYSTGYAVTIQSSLIHDYYMRECEHPILLTLDTTLRDGRMGIQAYVSVPIGVPEGVSGSMFTPVPVELNYKESDLSGLKSISKAVVNPPKSIKPMQDLNQIIETTKDLQVKLDVLLNYVNDVLARKRPPDNAVGRQLLDLIHSVPLMSPEKFRQMFNANCRDMLMVITLASLIKTQLMINEKLAFLPDN